MSVPKLAGLTAVVTGGASGIGLAAAYLLAGRGARVACLDLASDGIPESLVGIRADVADDDTVRAVVEEAAHRLGGIDIQVNNAGIGAQGTIEDNSDEEWRRVFDVNVLGVVRTTRAALPCLRRSRSAAIVNTCSIAATAGLPDRAADPEAERAALDARQPMGRLVTAGEVAAAIAYLASPPPQENRPLGGPP